MAMQTPVERHATGLLRRDGKCGVMGYPVSADGKRWRTWCNQLKGHAGKHGLVDRTERFDA